MASGSWLFSICGGEISKDAWCHLLNSHLHDWFMHVLKKSLTPAQADGECWKELTGRLALLSELGHSFLIIYNLYLQCIAQHEECSETGNFLDIKLVLFCLRRSPYAESPSLAGPRGRSALWLCSLLTSTSLKNNIGRLLV